MSGSDDSLIENTFISESNDILNELEKDFIELEKLVNTGSGEMMVFFSEQKGNILRNLHTLKGSSSLIEKLFIPKFIHTIETKAKKMYEINSPDMNLINLFLKNFDYIRYLVDTLIVKKENIDEAVYNANIAELEKTEGTAIREETNEHNERFDFFEINVPTVNTQDESLYYLRIRLNEPRPGKSWFPEDIIDDAAKSGKILCMKGYPYSLPEWDEIDFTQCLFEWIIVLYTRVQKEGIDDIFMFFREKSDIEIIPVTGKNYQEILERLNELEFSERELNDFKDYCQKNILKSEQQKEAFHFKRRSSDKETLSDELKISKIKIDSLIDLIGELIIVNSSLQNIQLKSGNAELETAQYKINQLSKQLRDITLSMKMVPIGQLLVKFHRMVRDLGKEFGKDVELVVVGENTEVDKGMFAVLEEALLHILRNSIDHGIELPEERLKKGKVKNGRITIKAYQENEQLIIEVTDDGKGLDRQKIINKGLEKNILKENEKYTDEEIFKLIFQPNFSTSESINLISGRGLGMDIAVAELAKVNGNIKVESDADVGTTFTIKLPLTLAIIEGFLIRIGANYFVIPLNFILECFEIRNENLNDTEMVYNLRNNYLSIIRLDNILTGILYDVVNDNNKSAAVISMEGGMIGLLADEIIGNIQVVIKHVTKQINKQKIFLGSTLLGNGEVAFILDVINLIKISKSKNKN